MTCAAHVGSTSVSLFSRQITAPEAAFMPALHAPVKPVLVGSSIKRTHGYSAFTNICDPSDEALSTKITSMLG